MTEKTKRSALFLDSIYKEFRQVGKNMGKKGEQAKKQVPPWQPPLPLLNLPVQNSLGSLLPTPGRQLAELVQRAIDALQQVERLIQANMAPSQVRQSPGQYVQVPQDGLLGATRDTEQAPPWPYGHEPYLQ